MRDIHSVNPEALTPWKAEMLWQLFVATSNHFSRTLDRNRLHAPDEGSLLERVKALAATPVSKRSNGSSKDSAAISRGTFGGGDCGALCALP